METELRRIAEIREKYPEGKLTNLLHIVNESNLKLSHRGLNGKKAAGVDEITKREYEENLDGNIKNLIKRMKSWQYRPQPSKRVYIPKEGNRQRPLGIPAYEDKIVQKVLAEILNQIYEMEFKDFSYGFRPGRSCHDALKRLTYVIENRKVNYVVDADIRGFFDNVSHERVVQFLGHRIADTNFLRLITRFLKAGIMELGKYMDTDKGTPQGGLISPILANVYLHYVLDLWFTLVVQRQSRGEAYMIRYADDFVCCFQYKEDAEKFYGALKLRLAEFGLEIAEEKSKIIEFGKFAEERLESKGEGKPGTFDFLGFTHYCGKSRHGKFRLKRVTSKKRIKSKAKSVKAWLKENMHNPVESLIRKLNVKLQGHYRYYGITDNFEGVYRFKALVRKILYKTLKRRSQKGMRRPVFEKLLERWPLARPKIYVSIYG